MNLNTERIRALNVEHLLDRVLQDSFLDHVAVRVFNQARSR